jgi:diadenosine tetraphosphate (Ap4A) HIT family hydrolase
MTCSLCERVDAASAAGESSPPVYEDEIAIVLVDSAPARRQEAWVIPKTHYSALTEMDERTGVHLVKLGMRAALSLGAASDDELEVLLESATEDADSHVHVRVYPRNAPPGGPGRTGGGP